MDGVRDQRQSLDLKFNGHGRGCHDSGSWLIGKDSGAQVTEGHITGELGLVTIKVWFQDMIYRPFSNILKYKKPLGWFKDMIYLV